MPLSAGARVGPYEVLSHLGSGGMGEVYRARDERLSREVALKVLPADVASDPARLKRFEKEARSASALNHPNIVTIYDVGSSDSVAYIAMERVEGKTLRELVADGPLSPRKVLQLAPQLAEGLARAHDAGIVHRDLKPENVMVTRDGLVKILDFGLAKLVRPEEEAGGPGAEPTVSAMTRSGVAVGTAGYMSPEQAAGHPVDFRSDQFAFGSVLYEMATGRPAFRRGTAVQTLAQIIENEPEPIAEVAPDTPVPLRWVVERCLAKDPDGRYASTKDLVRDLVTTRDRLDEASKLSEGWSLRDRRRALRVIVWVAGCGGSLLAGAFLARSFAAMPAAAPPSFHQVTFRAERIQSARFAPDGTTIVYGAVGQGKDFELFTTRVGSLESRPIGLAADILSISAVGEMAVLLGGPVQPGTLARAPLAGGAPREVLTSVRGADWSPDGKVMAAVHAADGKDRLESPIGNVLVESADEIGPPHFSRDGSRVLFADAGALAIVDASRKVSAVGEKLAPSGYGWSPAGDEVWMTVVVGSTTEVRALRPGGPERLVAAFPGAFLLKDVARNGRVLADRIAQHAPMMALAPGQTVEKDLSWLDASIPADLSSDGRFVLFTEAGVGGGESRAVFLRATDSSPAVRLGEGRALALSPDGKWALSRRGRTTVLLPTGAGQPQPVAANDIDFERGATFLPDGRVLLTGSAPGQGFRLYAWTRGALAPEPVTPPGVSLPEGSHTVSPDGRFVVASDARNRWKIYPLDRGSPASARPVSGLLVGETPVRWSADGSSLFVVTEDGALDRLDLATGARMTLRRFRPSVIACPTPDGAAVVWGSAAEASHLFLIEGLR